MQQNFYLFSTLYLERGFKSVSWNVLEAGHGKGPTNGKGGAIKRAEDTLLLNGGSIVDAKIHVLSSSEAESGAVP